jgi:hypothetical protein
MAALILVALYVPYCWLFFVVEWDWELWMKIFLVLPGLAIGALIPPPVSMPEGPATALILSAVVVCVAIAGIPHLKRAFWPTLASLFALSCGLSWIVYLLAIA